MAVQRGWFYASGTVEGRDAERPQTGEEME